LQNKIFILNTSSRPAMRNILSLLSGLLLLFQVSCGSKHEADDSPRTLPITEAEPTTSFAPAEEQRLAKDKALDQADESAALSADDTPAPPPAPATPPAPTSAPRIAARLLAYHASVKLKTDAMPRAIARLDSLVRRSSGYLSAATETRADGEWRQETTIRVPPTRFQSLLNGLAGLGTMEEKKLTTNDVTAEHADISARLQTKRAVERQYTALLGKAQKTNDILDIEEKLGEVREEIEATESRLKTLNSEVAYSTITLTLYQPLPQSVPDAPVVSLGSRTVEAFYGGWELLTSLFIGAINLWPMLLLGAGGWWLWQRRRARRKVAAPPTMPVA
jgi:hypothetical protein